ncbi:cation acetate symporter [Actinocorallia sp. A-T 12471]|uniref:sodium/solute symporter n=1 Tax=Actinocorallia sp. A-T 12471 TaxID=3089813 RepID=UPI0029CD0E14|nr:cation acetate symporter [Actinocorallia sp. A-T 12471]MDX6739330.1 cation acetate symporter [Actinocorallia sp. A-T 12471]
MNLAAVIAVALATLLAGFYGLRLSRTTSDFYVASRGVSPLANASAIGGEYVSAASFLGIAGLVLAGGVDMLWLPVGWTGGYLVLLVLVAAPLRRSGAYTLPDFAEARLESMAVRRAASLLVVLIGWLYLLPQLQAAGRVLASVTGGPQWAGGLLVAAVVILGVVAGGMRSITLVQALQYWLKLTALGVPLVFLAMAWRGDGSPGISDTSWLLPDVGDDRLYSTYSLILATFLGTMGLPHVLVRFYTNPDGAAARRTTSFVLALLGLFYLLPAAYGALGKIYAADLVEGGSPDTDTVVLELPARIVGGTLGDALGALLVAGAFAAFLSTSSGLTVSVAGVIGQDLLRGGVRSFRAATVVAIGVPLVLSLVLPSSLPVATMVGLAFALSASTFCPLLVLGIWWRGLTAAGALAGLVTGGVLAGGAVVWTVATERAHSWVAQPGAWTVPLTFLVMVAVSRRTKRPPNTARTMVRLHTPEGVELDRGDWRPRRI